MGYTHTCKVMFPCSGIVTNDKEPKPQHKNNKVGNVILHKTSTRHIIYATIPLERRCVSCKSTRLLSHRLEDSKFLLRENY